MSIIDQDEFYAEFGRRVQRARKASGLTQQALASLVSLSRTSVTNLERGRQKVLLHTLVDIAVALKVSPAQLLPEVNTPEGATLEKLLAGRPEEEQSWIKAAMRSAAALPPKAPDK